jgi:tetratricopeptide (TPR) repeat protein
MQETRKLAAVVFTDIVGYTTLMSKDEQKALQILQKNRDIQKPLVEKFNGEFLKEIGDGTLLCFQSALDALYCAKEIQQTVKDEPDLNLRIGIHIGDIIFKEGDVFGDGVNVASRIEQLAEAGGIFISGQVYETVKNKPDIEAVFLGERMLKNVDQPVRIYALTGEGLLTPSVKSLPAKPVKESGKKPVKKILLLVGIVLSLIIGFFLVRPFLLEEVLGSAPVSVAVLPFENETGDDGYDNLRRVVPNLFISKLEQSKFLQVTTWERMRDLLKQIGKADFEVVDIDKDTGFELCRKDEVGAAVTGIISKMGDRFGVEVKVLDVESKEILKSATEYGEGAESIYKLIDNLSKKISRGVGLSARKLASMQQPIAEVTTTSIEAYNYFLRGREEYEKFQHNDALRFLEKTSELDSTFAVAYLWLARTYQWLGNTKARNEAYEKAKVYSEKATDKEKHYIEAGYARDIEENQEKSFRILKQMARKYPKEKRVHVDLAFHYGQDKGLYYEAKEEFNQALKLDPNYGWALCNIAYCYAAMGDFEKAIENFKRYASVSPGDANPFDSMAEIYFWMGKLDEAIAKYKEALEVKPDFGSELRIAYIYAMKEDYPKAMEWIDRFIVSASSPGKRAEGYLCKGFYRSWLGSLDQSLGELRRAADLWRAVGNESWIALGDWLKGWIYYEKNEFDLSRKYFKSSFDLPIICPALVSTSPSLSFYEAEHNFCLGSMNLKQGEIDSARFRLTEMKSHLPHLNISKDRITFHYDLFYGEVLLAEDSFEKAISVCEKTSPLEMPNISYIQNAIVPNIPFLKDVLARAYLKKGELEKAIVEYERITQFDPNSKDRLLIHPKYHYRLAKLYEEKGLKDKAIKQYERFLEIWNAADESLPELVDARARLDKLKA